MKYNTLQATAHKRSTRVGRGISAGKGKTAGRGTKGQKSRSGVSIKGGFEGGQNPLMRRLPKLAGFRSLKKPAATIYTGQLDSLSGKTVDNQAVADAGLVATPYVSVKLIVKGEVSKKVTVKLQGASAAAIAAVEKVGGSFSQVSQQGKPKTHTSEKHK